ncbi:transglutaminase-like domain-containing protein [Streptomyces sp. NPDC058335]|uniref:transglutaminase-like domain-containing protein n=1 Tax=Streptomyces sp. NPDC058335 TaxID=3346451 RepID=UPI003648EFB5
MVDDLLGALVSLAFHTAHSTFSEPGDLAHHYTGLPSEPAQLARIARDLLVHRLEGGIFGLTHATDRLHNDAETRYVDGILRILVARDDAPLTRRREVGDRFVGVCRDFSLLLCSFLRHTGTPARIRSGFADYFDGSGGSEGSGSFHGDHVVTEYWDERRGWLLADAQLADPYVADHWKADFDPMDVPRDRFLVAGRAWRAIREEGADPRTFGLHPPEDGPLWGERFVAGNIRLDLAALNKVETLLWDLWGEEANAWTEDATDGDPPPMTDTARRVYDLATRVTADDVDLDTARRLFAAEDELRTPETVLCLAPYNGPSRVTLR